jgi:hypothetical protein
LDLHRNAIYHDLLLDWGQALVVPGVCEIIAAGFHNILVEECQDTNPLAGRHLGENVGAERRERQ